MHVLIQLQNNNWFTEEVKQKVKQVNINLTLTSIK